MSLRGIPRNESVNESVEDRRGVDRLVRFSNGYYTVHEKGGDIIVDVLKCRHSEPGFCGRCCRHSLLQGGLITLPMILICTPLFIIGALGGIVFCIKESVDKDRNMP